MKDRHGGDRGFEFRRPRYRNRRLREHSKHDLGMPPHGGFAIGLERLTAQILNLSNLRQATLYPRDRTKLTP
jgi:hypothetical protein